MHQPVSRLRKVLTGRSSSLRRSLSKVFKPTPGDVEKWQRLGDRLIDATVRRDKDPGWNYENTRTGEEKRLKLALSRPVRIPSLEKTTFFARTDIDTASLDKLTQASISDSSLEPGSFVELRRNEQITHGVVVRQSVSGGLLATMSLTTTGEVWTHRVTDIMFSIPGFIDGDLLRRCGTEAFATDDKMTAARLQVLKRTRDFERAVEAAANGVGQCVQELYPRVRASDPSQWAKISTMEATRMLDLRPNAPVLILLAVHKHLMRRSKEFIAHPIAHRQTHTFDVRPQSHIENIDTVTQWVRTNSPVLSQFAAKAQRIIDISRSLSIISMGEHPSRADVETPKFTDSDLAIIKFLEDSLHGRRSIQADPYASIVPSIVKKVARYEGEVESATVMNLLSEIGIHTPWEDLASRRRELDVPQAIPEFKPKGKTTSKNKSDGFYDTDELDSVRHDFGDMPVYVIDDTGAHELDDGLSYEAIPGEPTCAWIHTHIADPTAILPPDHSLSQLARKQKETMYFVHKTYPMLPNACVQRGLSLGMPSEDSDESAQKVMSFSFKIDGEGEIVDYRVRAGIVRKVHLLLYDDVNALLGVPTTDTHTMKPFVPQILETTPRRDLSRVLPHHANLKALFVVAQRMIASRRKHSVFSYTQSDSLISIRPQPAPENPPNSKSPIIYRGFPELDFSVIDYRSYETGARAMVAEYMKAASRVASRFCTESNIPVIRRAANRIECASDADFEYLLGLRNDLNYVDALEVLKIGVRASEARYTLKPEGHWALAIPGGEGYVRVTSPLRRYVDMVAHWQIKHALLPLSQRRGAAPFSESNLLAIIGELRQSDRLRRKAMNHSKRFWTHLYVDRFLRGLIGDRALIDPLREIDGFTVTLSNLDIAVKEHQTDVYMPKLGLIGSLMTQTAKNWPIGTPIKVSAKQVTMGLNPKLSLGLI